MRKFGYLVLAALFAFNIAIIAQNQDRGNRQNRSDAPRNRAVTAQQRVDRMATDVNLSEEQKAKVLQLFEKQDSIRDARRAEAQRNRQNNRELTQQQRDKMRAEMEEMRKSHDAELEKIIGKEKMEQYVKIRNERAQQFRDRGNRGNR